MTDQFVIATAGHVDHGKSALIRALTGMEPDRLAAEREQGRSIELGYCWTRLDSGTRVAFVDVPDFDSVEDANRGVAGDLLAAADLWLFVTTARRYADAVPWRLLRAARQRGAVVALALSLESPLALLLDEPFAGLQEQEIPRVLEHIAQRAAGGAIVVFVVRQAQAAAHLAERVHFLRPADAARQGAHEDESQARSQHAHRQCGGE